MSQLDDARYISLATFRKSGVRVDTPIWAAARAGKLYAFTEADSGKVKRLRNSSRAQVACCGARGTLLGDWADARAQVVEDTATIGTAYRALHEKYGWQMKLTDLVSKLTGRYAKRAILEIEVLEEGSLKRIGRYQRFAAECGGTPEETRMTLQSMPGSKPFHLEGNFAPVFPELTEFDLEVTGAIPPELRGRFFRNGSNPQSGSSPHWFLGNGMIHGVELRNGRATWYRNRYVRTPLFENPDAQGMAADGTPDRSASLANTHVICHAGKIMALEEGHFPWIVSRELETVGVHDFDGKLTTAMTAHPRICPETGELLFFAYGATPPYLTYHRVAADGTLVQSEEIEVKGPTMMHDWNVTRNHVVFMDLPMVFDLALVERGGLPIHWSDDYGARLGVMPRDGTNADVVWYEIDPCYVFHPMNSYEDGERIVLDVARYPKLAFGPEDEEGEPAVLHRWIIDSAAGKVIDQPLDERPAEFPRVADAAVGLKHRFGYMMTTGGDMHSFGRELLKYDLESGKSETCHFGAGFAAGEPVFVASPGAAAEDAGWVITYIHDASRGKSDLVIIDATDFAKGPIARVHLPSRVPAGFHGSWIPDEP